MEFIIMIACGALTLFASVMVIVSRNTVHSALWMIASFFTMAVLYLLLHAQFIAILQIIVYAGAIMMFIIYAIMMLNIRSDAHDSGPSRMPKAFGVVLLVAVFAGLSMLAVGRGLHALQGSMTDQLTGQYGHMNVLAHYLFSSYLLPFEVASVLLTAGIVGAVALAKTK